MNLVKVSDIFDIQYGNNLELNALEKCDCKQKPCAKHSVPFVARTAKNNGVSAFVAPVDEASMNPAHTLSVALSGSVLSTFYQEHNYYTGYHIYCLNPKVSLNKNQMLYYALCLTKNAYRYSYGRQANKTLKDILIPDVDSIPSWVETTKIPIIPNKSVSKQNYKLDIDKWGYFSIKDLFGEPVPTKGTTTYDLIQGNDIPYIGAKKDNNGLITMCSRSQNNDFISKGNCIVFIQLGAGSAGYTTYQESDFIGMNGKISCGYNDNLNKYNAMFLITILDRERPKFSYGRSWTGDRLKNTKIKLPTDKNGNPDWKFMENYIKSLPYSSSL